MRNNPAQETLETKALLSSLSEFSARAGHDLVGPLNQAGSLLALFIKRYSGKIDSEAGQLLEFLQSAAAKMEGAVTGIADYMAIASSPAASATFDLNAALASALASLEREISRTRATVEAGSLGWVVADRAQVAALFEILIGNSIKFRKPGIAPSIGVSAERSGGSQTIAVKDNGIGIDPKMSDLVFQPFRRLHGRDYPGAGLGLAVAKLIVERHGGSIEVVPHEEIAGACLRFTLPCA